MYNRFKKNEKVFVNGFGEINGKFYKNVPGIIVERDSFYLDYLIKFKDHTEDWILPENLRRPYERKNKNTKKRKGR